MQSKSTPTNHCENCRNGYSVKPSRVAKTKFCSVACKAADQTFDKNLIPPNPSGLCQCGCGHPTHIAVTSKSQDGDVAGHPRRFLRGHNTFRDFNSLYEIDPVTGCWNWVGTKPMASGHGRVGLSGRHQLAHRVSYTRRHGDLDPDLVLHHKCLNPSCVNPDHLEPMTQSEHVSIHLPHLKRAA